jgi:hypothetical protein
VFTAIVRQLIEKAENEKRERLKQSLAARVRS